MLNESWKSHTVSLSLSLSLRNIHTYLEAHTRAESSAGTRCVWVMRQMPGGDRGATHKKQNLIALFMWTTLIIANFNDLYAIHFYGGPTTTTTTATLAWTTRRMRNNFTRLKCKNVVNLGFAKALHSRHGLAYRIANLIHNPTQSCQALAATRVRLSIYTLLRWRNIEIVCAAKRKKREKKRRGEAELRHQRRVAS